MNEELQQIVERMIAAGESEEDIALVIREFKPKTTVQPSAGIGDHVGGYVGGFNRGVMKLIHEPLKILGAGQRTLATSLGYPSEVPLPGVDFAEAGKAVEEFTEKINPRIEGVSEFGQDVAEGVGQAAGMMATAGMGGGSQALQQTGKLATGLLPATGRAAQEVGKQLVTPTGFLGGAVTAAPEWEAAKAAGLSDDEAFEVLIKNYLVGQTDAIPIQGFLSRFNKIMNGAILEKVKSAGVGGLQEGIQEAFQTYLTNEIAKADYDPDRDPAFQVMESAMVGGVVGMFFPVIGSVMSKASPETRDKLAAKLVDLQTKAEIAKADPGDPAIKAGIDNQTDEITESITQQITPEVEGTQPPVAEQSTTPSPSVEPQAEVDPLTITETTKLPSGNEGQHFTIKLPGIGDAKGVIVGKKASILEIFAEKDEEGNPKKGGGLYGKVVNRLKKQGVNQIVVGMQSPASTAALQGMVRKGTLSVAKGSVEADEVDMHGNPIRFDIVSDLVTDFDESGALLGGGEESRAATKAASTEQIADFLRGKVKSRGEVTDFADSWNLKHPERTISDVEVKAAWDLIRVPKPGKGEVISAPISTLLKEQIKTFYRGVEKGVRKGQKLVNENLIPKVQEALKGAKLTPRQTSAILNRVKTTNLFTPGSQSRLNAFIDKVVGDAQYAEKLAKGKSLQKRVKKFGRMKSDEHTVNHKIVARAFGRLNPTEVKDLDEYIDRANSIIVAFRPVKSADYAEVDVTEMEDWVEKNMKVQEEEEVKDLDEKTESDLEELLVIAQTSLDQLNEKDLGVFDAAGKSAVETIKKIDLNQLDDHQLKRLIRVVNNIVVNDDLSGEAFVEALAHTQETLTKWEEMGKGVKRSQLGVWARMMYNISNMTKRVFQNKDIEAYLRSRIHGEVLTAGAQTEKALVDVSERFDAAVRALNKKYKMELRDIDNKADQMVFSLLYQMDNARDMAKMHRNIKETIRRNKEAGNETEAAAWEKAYKPFENVQSHTEARTIIEKQNPAVYEMWQLFGVDENSKNPIFTEQMSEEQARVTRELHNKEYATVVRYTPIVQHDVNTLFKMSKTLQEDDAYSPAKKIDPSESRTAKRRTLNLAANKVYTLEPYTDWILRYGETVYRNKASKAEARMGELIRNKKFTELMGGKENADALAAAFVRMVTIQRGQNRLIADNEAETFFTETAKTFRSVGTVKALASVSQILKQSTVLVKLSTNLMTQGDMDVLPAAIHAAASVKAGKENGVKKLLDQSTLIARGLRMGGTDRGNSEAYKLQRGARQWFLKKLEGARISLDKRTRASLSLLVRPDLFNARTAFLSYYLQSLKHQGVRDVDLNTEHQRLEEPARKTAMAYAENMVEQTQTASNPAAMSAIQAQTQSKGWEFVKTVFLPFSTFDADFKARFTNEVSALRRQPSSENLVRLGGTVGEALTFAAMNAFVLYFYKEFLRNAIAALTGVDRQEKTPEQIDKQKRQQFLSSIFAALNPIAIGTVGQEAQAWAINEVGYQVSAEEGQSKKEWMKENALVYEPREGSILENLGAYSTGITPLTESFKNWPDLVKSGIFGETVTIVDAYGNEKKVNLTREQQNILFLKSLAETLTLSGLTEADVANAIRTVYREEMKNADAAPAQSTNKKKTFQRKRKTYKRDE